MIARSCLALVLGGAAALSFHACSSDDPQATPPVGSTCSLNSDCNNPLSCTFGKCHKTCTESRDCPNANQRCLKVAPGPVCQLVDEGHCTYNSDCSSPLKCAVDSVCRVPCQGPSDCLPKQTCTSFVCADTFDLVDGGLDLPHTNPGGGWNGVSDDGGVGAGDASDAGASSTDDAATGDVTSTTTDAAAVDAASVDSGRADATAPADAGAPQADATSTVDGAGIVVDGGTCTATGLGTFHPSNLPAVLDVPSTVKPWVYTRSCDFDTDALTWDCSMTGGEFATRVVTLADGREAAALFVGSLQMNSGSKITFSGQRPLIVVAVSTIQIGGTIMAASGAQNAYYGGGAPGPGTPARNGICPLETAAGFGLAGASVNERGYGGGGGGFCKNGGLGTAPVDGGAPAQGGMPYGNSELVPLVGGSSGGSTAYFSTAAHGGGALQLVAGDTITITTSGIINMGGSIGTSSYGIGGGSGGAILLEAPTVKIAGVLAANGAGGGAYYSNPAQDGQPTTEQAMGGNQDNAGTRTAGKGGAGAIAEGGDGQLPPTTIYAGGGGGSAGRIRINSGCGGTILSQNAIVSPFESTACFTKGTLQ